MWCIPHKGIVSGTSSNLQRMLHLGVDLFLSVEGEEKASWQGHQPGRRCEGRGSDGPGLKGLGIHAERVGPHLIGRGKDWHSRTWLK